MVETGGCNLPIEIVELIFFRLSSFVDRVRFRSVCRRWQSFLPLVADCDFPPYLYYTRSNKIYSVTEDKTYHFQNHDFSGQDILCSSNGWFVLVDSDADVSIFNPFSGAQFNLPALWSLPDVDARGFDHINDKMVWSLEPVGFEVRGGSNLLRNLRISLSVSPTMASVIIYNNKFAFAAPYSEYWSRIMVPLYDTFKSVVYHDADHKFYAISRAGATISISQRGNAETVVPYDNILPGDYIDPINGAPYIGPTIASLPTGDLICIFMLLVPSSTMLSFDIRKLVRETGKTATWVRTESLDDYTIFLDGNGACARRGTNLGYRRNCIYFNLNHTYRRPNKRKLYHLLYNGIFDITRKNIQPIHDTNHSRRCALWIEPPKYD